MRKFKKGDKIICHDEKDQQKVYKGFRNMGLKVIKTIKDNKHCVEIMEDEDEERRD